MASASIFKELTESRPESTQCNWQKSTEFLLRSSNKSAIGNILFLIIKQELTGLWFHHTHNKGWKTLILVLQCSYSGTIVENLQFQGPSCVRESRTQRINASLILHFFPKTASLDGIIGLENHRILEIGRVIWFNLLLKQGFPEQLPRSISRCV